MGIKEKKFDYGLKYGLGVRNERRKEEKSKANTSSRVRDVNNLKDMTLF